MVTDPTDDPLLTDNDRRTLAAIAAEANPLTRAELIRAYYRDPDRHARTPRHLVAQHLDKLAGMVAGLALTLVDPATDAALTEADRHALTAIEHEANPAAFAGRVRAYWVDADRAARTSRAVLYTHCAMLTAAVDSLADAGLIASLRRAASGLCHEAAGGDSAYWCTRAVDHEGDHVAGIGPWRPGLQELRRWPRGAPRFAAAAARLTGSELDVAVLLAAELTAKDAPMPLELEPVSVLQFAGLLQLALRHPDVPAELRERAGLFLFAARLYFDDCPTILDALRKGSDPIFDVRRSWGQ